MMPLCVLIARKCYVKSWLGQCICRRQDVLLYGCVTVHQWIWHKICTEYKKIWAAFWFTFHGQIYERNVTNIEQRKTAKLVQTNGIHGMIGINSDGIVITINASRFVAPKCYLFAEVAEFICYQIILEITHELPSVEQLNRWMGEPIEMIIIPHSLFCWSRNSSFYLPAAHLNACQRFLHQLHAHVAIKCPVDDSNIADYAKYIRHLANKVHSLQMIRPMARWAHHSCLFPSFFLLQPAVKSIFIFHFSKFCNFL